MNRRILFFGDVHGTFRHVAELVDRDRPSAIVFLGDLEPQRPLEQVLADVIGKTEIRFIHGNHDTDSDANVANLFDCGLKGLNLHGRVETLAGLRVAGLGGIFRGEAWHPPEEAAHESYEAYLRTIQTKRGHTKAGLETSNAAALRETKARTHRSTIFPDVYDRLAIESADVLVTHEAPSCHRHGFTEIDELARALGVKAVFHGHHHDCLPYPGVVQRLGFRVHGVGFCGVTDLDGSVIRAGDYDADRLHRFRWQAGNADGNKTET